MQFSGVPIAKRPPSSSIKDMNRAQKIWKNAALKTEGILAKEKGIIQEKMKDFTSNDAQCDKQQLLSLFREVFSFLGKKGSAISNCARGTAAL